MYNYPIQGQVGFSDILARREELWPTAYDVGKVASQESVTGAEETPPADTEEKPVDPLDVAALADENIARHAVRILCERFMLVYDRLFLYYSTGSGKTIISSGAAEPLIRNVAVELVDSYLEPRRTNLRRVIVIVSSDAQKRDFMKKIVETSRKSQYQRAVRLGASQPINERLATYAAVLAPIYVFHTKTEFLSRIYGTASTYGDVDPTKPDPGGLAFANNAVILIDEIHSFSREENVNITSAAARRQEAVDIVDEGDEEPASPRRAKISSKEEEDFRYAQYHYVLHALQGSKIIGMSATPMKDSPQEIGKVMNLILPLDKQIPSGLNVLSREVLLPYLQGYVSYFRTRSTRVMNRGVMIPLSSQEGEHSSEFEVIFPVAMSEFQAKVYRRVITERDSFNRNALRASNIVYPDGSAGSAGFAERFVTSSRGWDGMEPNDIYRTFLRASRANREMLSPKFCAIADLCRISRGVVFVYMRNLEGGLYDLAAFLDSEGFERFTPQLSSVPGGSQPLFINRADGSHDMIMTKRPRYVLVIGETKTKPGRLDGILNLVNIDENADGEYVKVVLGSAAIRESFDIRNSITGINASPEQTKTAEIQAFGRILRPGAQRALFRKFPDLPPIVSLYLMASYLPNTVYEGKDTSTYLDSARKDRRIKVVERMLRDSSIDCQMLHSINYDDLDDVVDDSPACLYGPCDYVCSIDQRSEASDDRRSEDPGSRVQAQAPEDQRPESQDGISTSVTLDSSSMNALYRTEKLLRLKIELSKLAKRHVYIPIADVNSIVDSHALAQRVIETLSITKEQMRDRYGRQSYVYHDRNGLFFATSPVITGQVGDGSGAMSPVSMSDYEHYITTSLITPLDLMSGTALLLPGTLETILLVTPTRSVTDSVEADRELLQKFAIYLRREVVPKSALLEHVRVRGEQRAHGLQGSDVYWVDYSCLLYTRGELRVYKGDEGISYLIDKTSSGQPLRFAQRPVKISGELPSTWATPGSVLMHILHQRWRGYMRSLFASYEARFPFYGVIRPSEPNILRIVRRGRDNAKTPGRALPSWSSEDIREVIATLFASGSKVTEKNREQADKKLEALPKLKDINDYLIAEFEKRSMLLRL